MGYFFTREELCAVGGCATLRRNLLDYVNSFSSMCCVGDGIVLYDIHFKDNLLRIIFHSYNHNAITDVGCDPRKYGMPGSAYRFHKVVSKMMREIGVKRSRKRF